MATAPTIKELSRHPEWEGVRNPKTPAGVFADWLDEHDRPDLAILARTHKDRDERGRTYHPEDGMDGFTVPRRSGKEDFHSPDIDPVWGVGLYDAVVQHSDSGPVRSRYAPHITTVIGASVPDAWNRVLESPLTREQFRQFLVHAHRTGLYDTKTLKKWAAHGIFHGWIDPDGKGGDKVKLARHTDVYRGPEFWAFLANHARTGDATNRGAFADWLEERGDPRALIVRHHVEPDEHGYYHHPDEVHPDGWNVPWYDTYGHLPSPEGFRINAHSLVKGGHATVRTADGASEYRPAVMWQMHVPRTKFTPGLSSRGHTTVFHAPLTMEQAERFVSMIPKAARPKWAAWLAALHKYRKGNAIVGHGDERPERLARSRAEYVDVIRKAKRYRWALIGKLRTNPTNREYREKLAAFLDKFPGVTGDAEHDKHLSRLIRLSNSNIMEALITQPENHHLTGKRDNRSDHTPEWEAFQKEYMNGPGWLTEEDRVAVRAAMKNGGDMRKLAEAVPPYHPAYDAVQKAAARENGTGAHRWVINTPVMPGTPRRQVGAGGPRPIGNYHHPDEHPNAEEAALHGIMGVMHQYVDNSRVRVRLARKQPEPQQSLAGATAERTSQQTAARAQLARQVLKEAGLTPSAVRQVLAHEGKAGLKAAILQMIAKHVHPARTRYAAAWYGLLSGERRLTVFHPHPKGEDLVHVITSPAASDQVAGYMQQAGVPRFVIDPDGGGGTRAYVFDQKGQMGETMKRLAGGLNGSHTAIRGFGYRLGAGEGSDADTGAAGGAAARQSYRDTIRSYERSAGIP